jgi:PAS domain S-box-containing protein
LVGSEGATGVDGQERLGALAPVREYGWVAGYSRTTEAVFGGLAAVTLLACLVALLLGRGLSGRLARLAADARAFGRGETSGPAPSGGSIEVQELATACNAMAEEVRTRFAEREAAEARYRGIFEGALEGIFQTGFDGRFRTVNPAAARMLGYDTPEELIAAVTDVRQLYADPARFGDYLREVQARGVVTGFEFEIRRRDGSTRWVTLNARALPGEDGRIAQVDGMATDITDRKAAAETRLRLAAIIDSSDDAIIGKTLDGVITSWNRAAERMYGYAAEEAVGRSIGMLVPDDRPDELPAILARLRRGEPISRYETERVRRDGTRLTVSLTISPIEDEGRTIGASTIARDITESKRAETAARLLAEITRELVAAGVDLSTLLDRVARRTAELLGDGCLLRLLSDDGRTLEPAGFHHTGPALAEEIRAMLAVPYRADEGLDGEVIRTGHAALLPVVDHQALLASTQPELRALVDRIALRSIVVAPVRSRGRILGTLGVGRNAPGRPFTEADAALVQEIADRAGLAIDNARLYRDAREALRVRDEFLSSLSHDLRTPLATIKGMAQLLGRQLGRLDLAEARRLGERAATIDRAAARMGAMVDELLDLARLQAGRPLELNRAAVDLVALARAAVEEQAALNPGHALRLDAETPALVGVWDAARLERVLSNLLSNAIKYSPDGGAVEVGVRPVPGDEGAAWAALTVRDRGVGIPAGDLPFIFEWFHRGANVARRVSGIGIGLAGVKHIVERHEGTIDVASTEGAGTLVTVRLPLTEPEIENGEERV